MPWAPKWKQEEPSTQVVHFQLVSFESLTKTNPPQPTNIQLENLGFGKFTWWANQPWWLPHLFIPRHSQRKTVTHQLFDPSVLAQGKGFSLQLPGVLQEANQGFKTSDGFDDFGEVAGEPQKLWKIWVGEGGKSWRRCKDQSYICILLYYCTHE